MAGLTDSDRERIHQLYVDGLSARQIAETMHCGVGAVTYALRKMKTVRRTSAASNLLVFESKKPGYTVLNHLTEEQEKLKLSACMLYWAEGYKAGKYTVDFANSDPDMVALFVRFLREICGVQEDKLRCSLRCYDTQDAESLRLFWSKKLSLSLANFTETLSKRTVNSIRGHRMQYGLVHVRYCDKKLLTQILVWIDEYRAMSVGGRVVNYNRL